VPSDKRARQRAAREARLAQEAKQQKRRKQIRNAIIVVLVAGIIVAVAFIVSSGNKTPVSSQSKVGTTTTTTTTTPVSPADALAQLAANAAAVKAGCPASPATRVNTQHYSKAPAMTIDTSLPYTATVNTTAGTFTIALDAKAAPEVVNNFVFLAQKGFYNCNIFHRVIPGFMDQTGDPTGTGLGSAGYSITSQNVPTSYADYDVAMATSQAKGAQSQWFVLAKGGGAHLGGGGYPLFGQVVSGQSVVDTINSQGNANPSSNGVPPNVTQRIISVSINS